MIITYFHEKNELLKGKFFIKENLNNAKELGYMMEDGTFLINKTFNINENYGINFHDKNAWFPDNCKLHVIKDKENKFISIDYDKMDKRYHDWKQMDEQDYMQIGESILVFDDSKEFRQFCILSGRQKLYAGEFKDYSTIRCWLMEHGKFTEEDWEFVTTSPSVEMKEIGWYKTKKGDDV